MCSTLKHLQCRFYRIRQSLNNRSTGATLESVVDPQRLAMKLSVDGVVKQDASTAQQIFPVAAVIEFISQLMTLEPGDIISTGTSAGVGSTTGDFLKPGDQIEAEIESIGILRSPVE